MPHSDIPGSKPAGGSPGLFAAIHVLHRLLVPRHPPCALASSASRSFEFTKPAGSMFSKNPCSLCFWFRTSLGQERPERLYLSAQLLFDYSGAVRPERAQKKARHPSSHSGHGKSSATYAVGDSSLRMMRFSSDPREHTPGNRQCAHPAKIHYIPPPSKRASDFALGRCAGWSRGDSNP